MENLSSTQKRWKRVGLYVALWTTIAVAEAVSLYMGQLRLDKPIGWDVAFRRCFKEWYAFGFLAIGILWFCRRVKLEPGKFPSWLAKHFLASIIFAPIYVAAVSWLQAGERSVQTGEILTFTYLFTKYGIHYFFWDVIMYWMVVIAQLAWQSYERHREHELEEAELREQLVEARLEALRMQLNPHFLFNTLHTISALIHENPEAADRVVARLSELLRSSLDRSNVREVPLHQELSFLDRYLDIEQTRFADRLEVTRDIQPGLQNALVPFLILQPLVENAIRHGIEQREEKGHLTIRAHRNNGQLELSVSDNGNGLPEDNGSTREGIGLSNTRSRLRHQYGADHSLELKSVPGGGLEARIVIPYRT